MKNLTITVCDFETGGLDAKKNPITEVGMLNFDLETKVVNWEYQTFVKPYAGLEINPIVYEKTQVRPEDVANGKDFKTVVKEMSDLFDKAKAPGGKGLQGSTIMLGHNFVNFDRRFMEELFNHAGKDVYNHINGSIIDTLPLSKTHWIGKDKYTLIECCKRIGYDLVGAHGAMNDVRGNFELAKYLLFNDSKSFSGVNIPSEVKPTSKHRKFFNF